METFDEWLANYQVGQTFPLQKYTTYRVSRDIYLNLAICSVNTSKKLQLGCTPISTEAEAEGLTYIDIKNYSGSSFAQCLMMCR